MRELQRIKGELATIKSKFQQQSTIIMDLNSKVLEMEQLLGNKNCEIAELKEKLNDQTTEINKKCQEQFNDKQERVDAIIKIALAERESIYNDIDSLIRDSERFSLKNLMNYTPQAWLNKRNQVVVKFIETLTHNSYNSDELSQEKLFKRAVAVDAIYGSRHGKYVSEINLAASAIKYSLARSKKVINIDNHITSAGSYSTFQNWLDALAEEEERLPNGLLFLAFDNEQKGQKNYLDRGSNIVIYHIVTSFVAFNMESQNEIQHHNTPWLHKSLGRLQYEELFDITPQMEEEINKELRIYLSEILDILCEEKSSTTNAIEVLIANNNSNNNCNKQCFNCSERGISNRKQICPKCNTRLPTLSELQQNLLESETRLSEQLLKPAAFKPFNLDGSGTVVNPHISITQRPVADQGVNVPEIYVPDPLNVNPNSIANVEKILLHVKKISGIEDGTRKWVAVECDGVPYNYIIKLKRRSEIPWLVPIPGQLHEEMNMLRAYVELNW